MFLNLFCLIKKISFIDHNIIIVYFHIWKITLSVTFSTILIKQKVYLLLENLEQLKNLNICFVLDFFRLIFIQINCSL